jgi:hypothetical protein
MGKQLLASDINYLIINNCDTIKLREYPKVSTTKHRWKHTMWPG